MTRTRPSGSRRLTQALALKIEPTRLAAEALASGSVDLGVRGLELLTGGASEQAGETVLLQAMLTRKDDLAIEAAKLLIARLGPVPRRDPCSGSRGGKAPAARGGVARRRV